MPESPIIQQKFGLLQVQVYLEKIVVVKRAQGLQEAILPTVTSVMPLVTTAVITEVIVNKRAALGLT